MIVCVLNGCWRGGWEQRHWKLLCAVCAKSEVSLVRQKALQ